MSTKVNAALNRRAALRFGAVGAAATAATVATTATAEAAAGQPVLQGRVNTPGATDTSIVATTAGIAFTVKNTGAGAAGYFFAAKGNGFAGGTSAPTKVGLSTANTGPAGTGAAMGAVGVNNTGVLASTYNVDRYALEATNFSTTESGDGGAGGGIWADGGDGVGIAALSPIGVPAVVSIGDTYYIEGHEVVLTLSSVVYGVTSANGPEVTFSGQITLNGSGAGAATLDAATVADVDLTEPVSLVSPITGPMPNLWISTSPAGVVSVAGGAAGGTVSYRVIGVRNDWSIALDAADTRAKRTTARAKSLATALLKRAGR